MLVHGRFRNSDAKAITRAVANRIYGDGWELVAGFMEATALEVKTATSKEKKRKYLPLTAILRGLTGLDWFWALAKARRQIGLPELDVEQNSVDP